MGNPKNCAGCFFSFFLLESGLCSRLRVFGFLSDFHVFSRIPFLFVGLLRDTGRQFWSRCISLHLAPRTHVSSRLHSTICPCGDCFSLFHFPISRGAHLSKKRIVVLLLG